MRNERGVIVTWLLKVILVLVVVGSIAFDIMAIVVNYFTLDSAADDAAVALSLQIDPDDPRMNSDQVFLIAQTYVGSSESNVHDATVIREGTYLDDQDILYLELRRPARTLIVNRVEALRRYGIATGHGRSATN